MKILNYAFAFVIIVSIGMLYDKYLKKYDIDSKETHNKLIEHYLLNGNSKKDNKPILWIHIPYKINNLTLALVLSNYGFLLTNNHTDLPSNIKFGLVFGSNAIVAYVLHGIVWRIFQFPLIEGVGFQQFWMDTGIGLGLSANFVSLDWAISLMLLIPRAVSIKHSIPILFFNFLLVSICVKIQSTM